MSAEHLVISILCGLIVGREIIYQVTLHRLVNKIMSRSFHEYELGKAVSNRMSEKPKGKAIEDPHEDFGVVEDFGLN